MSSRRFRWIGLATLATLACSPEPIGGPGKEVPTRPSFEITGSCSASGVSVGGFIRNWSCGDRVRFSVTGGTSSEISALNAAASLWNEAVLGFNNLPRFDAAGSRVLNVSISGSGTWYCGQVVSGSQMNIGRFATSTAGCTHAGSLNNGTLDNLFLHELSHAIGFQSGVWHKPSTTTFTGHCASALYTSGRPLNSDVCQHEIEAIRAAYGLRSTAPNLSKHVMTGLLGLSNRTLDANSSTVLTVTNLAFRRANGTMCGQPDTTSCGDGAVAPPNATFTWSSSSSVVTLSGTGASRTVTSGTTAGQSLIKVNATTSTYEKAVSFGDPGTGTSATVTVTVSGPAARPTNLAASNITATSATITWTNGDASAGTTTIVQYRMAGQSTWITASSGLPAGQSSFNLTGLVCATTYEVNIFHRKNGIDSPWLTLQLFTTLACTTSTSINAPTGFTRTRCTTSTAGGKTSATYTLSWTAGSNPASSTYQIGTKNTNTPSTAFIVQTGPISTRTDQVGPYVVSETASPVYVWVRHANGAQASSWTPLAGNPILIADGCLQ